MKLIKCHKFVIAKKKTKNETIAEGNFRTRHATIGVIRGSMVSDEYIRRFFCKAAGERIQSTEIEFRS